MTYPRAVIIDCLIGAAACDYGLELDYHELDHLSTHTLIHMAESYADNIDDFIYAYS